MNYRTPGAPPEELLTPFTHDTWADFILGFQQDILRKLTGLCSHTKPISDEVWAAVKVALWKTQGTYSNSKIVGYCTVYSQFSYQRILLNLTKTFTFNLDKVISLSHIDSHTLQWVIDNLLKCMWQWAAFFFFVTSMAVMTNSAPVLIHHVVN